MSEWTEVDFTLPSGTVSAPSAEVMRTVGEKLGAVLRAGDVVVLTGPLGAGKTTFTQGLARGLGARGRVQSPTFAIIREHQAGRRPDGTQGTGMLHMDAYRLLGDAVDTAVRAEGVDLPRDVVLDMLESLDVDADLGDRVLVAEWGRGVVESLSTRVVDVEIRRDCDDRDDRDDRDDCDDRDGIAGDAADIVDSAGHDGELRELTWSWHSRVQTSIHPQ